MTLAPEMPTGDRAAVFVARLELGAAGPQVAIKDSIDIAGHPTRLGSAVFADAPAASRHATVVQDLLDAGCRIVGKTNMHELAYGVTGINPCTGIPVNPRYPDRVPGGSSSGSAVAVAAGDVDFAIGTDTGGSIRIPAVCCGVFGLKPTYGRISRAGVHPAHSSLDCVGPFARDLATLERAMSMMDRTFLSLPVPRALQVGMVEVAANPAVAAVVQRAASAAGVSLRSIRLPSFGAAFDAGLAIIGAENWSAYGRLLDAPGLGADIRARLLIARDVSAQALAAAEACRAEFTAEVDAALEHVDALLLPTLPEFPLPVAAADARAALRSTALVRPFNLSGHPALTVPLESADSLPVGLQLVARRGADAALCALAHRFVPGRSFP
jgi:amidase